LAARGLGLCPARGGPLAFDEGPSRSHQFGAFAARRFSPARVVTSTTAPPMRNDEAPAGVGSQTGLTAAQESGGRVVCPCLWASLSPARTPSSLPGGPSLLPSVRRRCGGVVSPNGLAAVVRSGGRDDLPLPPSRIVRSTCQDPRSVPGVLEWLHQFGADAAVRSMLAHDVTSTPAPPGRR